MLLLFSESGVVAILIWGTAVIVLHLLKMILVFKAAPYELGLPE